jgi:transposase
MPKVGTVLLRYVSMATRIAIEVKESLKELQVVWRKASAAIRPRIKMLQLMKAGSIRSKDLAAKIGVCTDAVAQWKRRYSAEGLQGLALEGRGGSRNCPLSPQQMAVLRQRLENTKQGFTSYVEALHWINHTFGLAMKYQAANKFLKRNFHTRLKVGRKVHAQKNPEQEGAFKKEVTRDLAKSL